MSEKLEEKAEEEPKILNDNFRDNKYKELNQVNLHNYFLTITHTPMLYPQNPQITFTP